MYYTSVLGAECIALLCSASRVASASFIKVTFSDVLVSSTLTLPVNIYTWKKKKPCSPGASKIYSMLFKHLKLMFTGSVSVLLTSTSLKITLMKLAEATRETEHRSAMHSAPSTEV